MQQRDCRKAGLDRNIGEGGKQWVGRGEDLSGGLTEAVRAVLEAWGWDWPSELLGLVGVWVSHIKAECGCDWGAMEW